LSTAQQNTVFAVFEAKKEELLHTLLVLIHNLYYFMDFDFQTHRPWGVFPIRQNPIRRK